MKYLRSASFRTSWTSCRANFRVIALASMRTRTSCLMIRAALHMTVISHLRRILIKLTWLLRIYKERLIQPKGLARFYHHNGFHYQFIKRTVSACQGPSPVLGGAYQCSPRRLSARYVRPDENDRKVGFAQASVETWRPQSSVSTTILPQVLRLIMSPF